MNGELLTTEDVATLLQVTPRFVRGLVAQRRIDFVKVGRLVRFEPEAVAVYIGRNRVNAVDRMALRREMERAA